LVQARELRARLQGSLVTFGTVVSGAEGIHTALDGLVAPDRVEVLWSSYGLSCGMPCHCCPFFSCCPSVQALLPSITAVCNLTRCCFINSQVHRS
jgi:hypothetical protein